MLNLYLYEFSNYFSKNIIIKVSFIKNVMNFMKNVSQIKANKMLAMNDINVDDSGDYDFIMVNKLYF